MPVIRMQPARARLPWVALGLALAGVLVLAWWWWQADAKVERRATLRPESTVSAIPAVVLAAPPPASAPPEDAVPAADQQVTASPLNYDSVDDMYALAVRAANSTDPMVNYNGAMALFACRVQDRSRLGEVAAGAVTSPEDREQVRAAALVLRRCSGVFNNDESANKELLQRLMAVVRKTPGFFPIARLPGVPTLQDFQLAVDRGDWATLQEIINRTFILLQTPEAATSQTVSEAELLAYSAGSLASCELGRNCGPDGFEYASSCASGNGCQGSLEAFTRQDRTPAQWARIQALRQEIVAAVRRRDAAYFGFPR